jgi:hypothetical protein
VLLRSIRSHLVASCATLALAFVVAAGAVGVFGASRAGHTPAAVAAMLALYGAVALAEQSARSTVDRIHDVALARLRGMTGMRLVAFAAGPLLAVSLVGVVLGTAAGTLLARRIADGWHTSYTVGAREILVGLALLLGAWATVALVAASVIRRPLGDALSVHPRRRSGSWLASFLEILVVAAAVLAVYEAHRRGHGWVPIVAPALVALAAGQVVAWLLLLVPRFGRRLGPALTSRRLRRDPDPASVVRILVAATVLLAVTLTGGRAAAAWRDDSAHLRAGGPLVVPFADGAVRAYAAAHDADPDGRWLMAAVSVDDLRPADRRVFVDAARWPAVVGDFMQGTSVASATARMSELAAQPDPVLMHGTSLRVLASGFDATGGRGGLVVARYVGDRGFSLASRVPVTGDGWATSELRSCRVGCSLLSLTVKGAATFDVRRVVAGTQDLIADPVSFTGTGSLPVLSLAETSNPPPDQAMLALTTRDVTLHAHMPGVDGQTPAVRVVGGVDAVPFLGRSGSLLDLSRVLRGSVGTVAGARPVVVARVDTPASVMTRLRQDGGGSAAGYSSVREAFDATPEARADSLALLVAVGVALVALTHLAAWLAGQMGRRRAEVAGLRAAGLLPRVVRRAYVVEAIALAGIVLVAATVAAAATTTALLRPMRLVGGWAVAPALDLAVRPWVLTPVALGVALVTGACCAVVFTRFGRSARPGALREAER